MINRYASLKQGLVGAWCPSLGASGFRLIDRSGYGNHGVLTGMDPGTDWVPSGGKLALDFDGVDDYVDINISKPLTEFTVSLWFNARSFANSPLIYTWFSSIGTTDWGFLETNSTGSQLYFGNRKSDAGETGYRNYTLSSALQVSSWVHCVMIKNTGADSGSLWVNGIQQTSHTGVLYASLSGSTKLRLAAYTSPILALNGQLDDIRIYNRVLTPQEIRLLYTGGRGVGLIPERIKHRRKTAAAATNRRRRLICGANC